ncbi:RNA polymerase sigma factor [Streptomyces sp. NBC_00879]|uniref:RNA polymerase sigma factor n=1 Tax=Streptomyces sp. NBC_00879 TaxID=2975855 RepID=UPI00386A49ED|nr:RNA polymerase sigma factor [Streptomyces sp. NBC_00879]
MNSPPERHTGDASVIAESLEHPDVFGELFRRHAADIHRYAARRLGDTSADDITAETFLIAFRKRAGYDLARPSALPWLYGIEANRIGEQRRSEVRRLRAMARSDLQTNEEPWTDRADSRVTAESTHRLFAGALAALPARDRHVLLLVAWADLTYPEVAEALSIPIGTVRSRLNRARRKLRAAAGAAALPDPARNDLSHAQEATSHG